MWNFIKKHKLFVSTLFTVVVITAVLGVQFGVVPENGNQTVGQGSIVLKIGTVEASGTVDYVCDGTDDNIQLQGALDALPANGGKIEILAGNYDFANGTTVTRVLNNVTISGTGRGTYITCDGATAIFTAGGNNWTFRDLRTDAGGLSMAATTGWSWENVTINATYYAYRTDDLTTGSSWNIPTGRTATYVIAASDAPLSVRNQADIICDGVADQVEINAAIALLPNYYGGEIELTSGNFSNTGPILITRRGGASNYYGRVKITGAGIEKTRISLVAGSNCDVISTNGVEIYFIEIGGMSLYGQTTDVSGHGLNADGMTFGYFHNLFLNNCKQDGFHLSSEDGIPGGFACTVQDVYSSFNGGCGFYLTVGSNWFYNLKAYHNNLGYHYSGTESFFNLISADTNETDGFYISLASDSKFAQIWAGQNKSKGLNINSSFNNNFVDCTIAGNQTTADGHNCEILLLTSYNNIFSQINVRATIATRGIFINTTHNNTFSSCVIVAATGFFDYVNPATNTSSIFMGNQFVSVTPIVALISGEATNLIRSNIGEPDN